MLNRLAVFGSGSWATALVKIFAESGVQVFWLINNPEQGEYIQLNGKNPRYLSFADLDLRFITIADSAEEILQEAEVAIFAVPAAYLETYLVDMQPQWFSAVQPVVSIKGFIPGTGLIPGLYIQKFIRNGKESIVLGGPCHAEEIARHRNTYLTIAGKQESFVNRIKDSIRTEYIRTVANNDPHGVEYAAILKNIIGIASGIASGLNFGDNFQAVLVSNAMREIGKFLDFLSPGNRDLNDSAYFGDMLVTAYSDFSRNRTLGKLVGRGMQAGKALELMEMVAEGYHASAELDPMIRASGLHLPILNGVYRILHQHANPFHEFRLIEQYLR